jgi:hypothetical protein
MMGFSRSPKPRRPPMLSLPPRATCCSRGNGRYYSVRLVVTLSSLLAPALCCEEADASSCDAQRRQRRWGSQREGCISALGCQSRGISAPSCARENTETRDGQPARRFLSDIKKRWLNTSLFILRQVPVAFKSTQSASAQQRPTYVKQTFDQLIYLHRLFQADTPQSRVLFIA